ncbi:MAG: leucine-rich repeat domain-containing protein [Anaerolineales bacterium]
MAHDQAYLEAEEKIEEALKSGATELDLRGMKLTELPESIGQLIQLLKLNLGWDYSKEKEEINQLTTLPESLGQLTQLTELNLSNNQLTALPDSLGQLRQLQTLDLSDNQLTTLPESLGQLTQLTELDLSKNQLISLPESLGQLTQLQKLYASDNKLTELPVSLIQLKQLQELDVSSNQLMILPEGLKQFEHLQVLYFGGNPMNFPDWVSELTDLRRLSIYGLRLSVLPDIVINLTELEFLNLGENLLTTLPSLEKLKKLKILWLDTNKLGELPDSIGHINNLEELWLFGNQLNDIPPSLAQLENLKVLDLDNNPLNPELSEAYEEGLDAVKLYLRLKIGPQVILNEAKLILVGEGEVGKTCLMDALLDKEWQEHASTHGIEIQQIIVTDLETEKEITLNGWDFGGQRVYRPTHQLFFSAPAVYLVVWKPREGPQQGFVKEWIQLVKRREPGAKIIIVATHGGPQQRQPDIDRQELWDAFGKETVVDFFFVDSKPDSNGNRKGIAELKLAIARVAATLPEVGRSVPKSFQDVRLALQAKGVPYLPLNDVLAICRAHNMDDEIARLFITISHRLGHLTHYENDPALRDIVILRPDWLASAMSYVLDDEETRNNQGLVKFTRLSFLWNDPARPANTRYPEPLQRRRVQPRQPHRPTRSRYDSQNRRFRKSMAARTRIRRHSTNSNLPDRGYTKRSIRQRGRTVLSTHRSLA